MKNLPYFLVASLILILLFLTYRNQESEIVAPALIESELVVHDFAGQESQDLETSNEITLPQEITVGWARAHREMMSELIVSDPKAAIASMVSPRVRASLSEEIVAELPEIVIGQGYYGVEMICNHVTTTCGSGCEHGDWAHEVELVVVMEDSAGGFVDYEAHVYGERLHFQTLEDTAIFGVAVDGQIALHEKVIPEFSGDFFANEQYENEPEGAVGHSILHEGEIMGFASAVEANEWVSEREAELLALEAHNRIVYMDGPEFVPGVEPTNNDTPPWDIPYNEHNSHALGPKTLLVIPIQASDHGEWSNPPTRESLIRQAENASEYYYHQSYRQTWFGDKTDNDGVIVDMFEVAPVIELPNPHESYYDNLGSFASAGMNGMEALGGEYAEGGAKHHSRYDRIIIFAQRSMVSSAGRAGVGGRTSFTANGIYGGVALHELGHNWGVYHANYWDGANNIPRNGDGDYYEYRDGMDLMGGGGSFNELFREDLGFITPEGGGVYEVDSVGNHLVRLYDHTNIDSGGLVRSIKIPITGTNVVFDRLVTLGYRFDKKAIDGGDERRDRNRNGVEIHSKGTDADGGFTLAGPNSGSHFLDSTPGSRPEDGYQDRDDGTLLIGRTYSEPADLNQTSLYGELHATPVARGSIQKNGETVEYIDVEVNMGDYSTNLAPSVHIESVSADVAVGEAALLTAIASDPDGDSLAYSWSVSDGRYSIENISNYSPIFNSPGLYRITVTVSDKKGGVADAGYWINVGNQPVHTPSPPEQAVEGLRYSYYEVAKTAMPDFRLIFPKKTGTAPTINHGYKERFDEFAFVFEGYIEVPNTEIYTFVLNAEDGAIFEIAGSVLIDNGESKSIALEKSGSIALEAGLHPIRVSFFHNSGSEALSLRWRALTTTGDALVGIPSSAFKQIDPTLRGDPTVEFTSPSDGEMTEVGEVVSFSVNASDPDGIEQVVYFVNGIRVGESDQAPFGILWDEATIGTHELVAVAYDNNGLWAKSAPVSLVVESEFRNMISLNIRGTASSSEGQLAPLDEVGAVYAGANWNNVANTRDFGNSGFNSSLKDNSGNLTQATLSWNAQRHNSGETLGDFSTPAGKMMRGTIANRHDTGRPSYKVRNIGYTQYDVYVYIDAKKTDNADSSVGRFDLTDRLGNTETIYGHNSLSKSDDIGDYPTYDTFTGFKESTARTPEASDDVMLGNYLVFRNQTTPGFDLVPDHVDIKSRYPGVTGIQIIEAPVTVPRAVIVESDFATTVSESGAADTFDVSLSVAPTAGSVAVILTPGPELSLSQTVLVFDRENYNVAQTVQVFAVDDLEIESDHTDQVYFAVEGLGNYSGLPDRFRTVAIADNDRASIEIYSVGEAEENGVVATRFIVKRDGLSDLSEALPISFTVSGDAEVDNSDFTLSATGLSYDPATGNGTVDIASGESFVELVFTPVDDALPEGTERVRMTLTAYGDNDLSGSGYAEVDIIDDDAPLYFVQKFLSGGIDEFPDVNNKKLTFVPDGSASYYRAYLEDANALPEDTTGHTNWGGSSNIAVRVNEPIWFYGVEYSRFFVHDNGQVLLDDTGTGQTATQSSLDPANASFYRYHFGNRRIAAYWMDLYSHISGRVSHHRDDTVGSARSIISWEDVRSRYSSTDRLTTQIVAWDDVPENGANRGRITITWVNTNAGLRSVSDLERVLIGLSNESRNDLPDGFRMVNFSDFTLPTNANESPEFDTEPLRHGVVGEEYSYVIGVSDRELDALVLQADTLPAWLSFQATSTGGILSGTPPLSGDYAVSLSLSYGENASVIQSFSIGVRAPVVALGPTIVSQPVSISGRYNESAGFSVIATGDHPMQYQWRKGGVALSDGAKYTGTTTATLTISNLKETDEGDFDVVLENGVGSAVISDGATLAVDDPIPVSIITNPSGISVVPGDDFALSVEADGSPTLVYQWNYEGLALSDNDVLSGVNTDTLQFTSINVANAGSYSVTVSNDNSSTESSGAIVDVNNPPAISVNFPAGAIAVLPSITNSLLLDTTVTDESSLSFGWDQVSGPGSATFATESAEDTWVDFDTEGSYVLRLTANDGVLTSEALFTVRVGDGVSGPSEDVPSGSIVGFWKLNGNVSDDSGNGYDGELVNGASFGTGLLNQGVVLDGADDYVDLNAPTLINFNGPNPRRSISLWFNSTDVTKAARQLIFEEGGTSRGFSFYVQGGTLYVGGYEDDTSWNGPWLTSTAIQSGAWHHLAITLDGGATLAANAFTAYLDGLEIGKTSGSQLSDHGGENSLGAVNTNTRFADGSGGSSGSDAFEGMVDQLVIYNRVLAPEEVSEMAVGPALNEAPQVNAGSDGNATASVSQALVGSATDDGLPESPGEIVFLWEQLSGPASPDIVHPSSANSAITFPANGNYELRLVASDGAIKVGDTVVFTVSGAPTMTPRQIWRQSYFGVIDNSGNAADLADPDGDGVTNIFERAFKTGPLDAESRHSPSGSQYQVNGDRYVTLTFRRLKGGTEEDHAYTVDDLVYRVEVSSDLANWLEGPAHTTTLGEPVDNGDGTETISIRSNQRMQDLDKQFIRLILETK